MKASVSFIAILIIFSVSVFANVASTEYSITNNGKQILSDEAIFVEKDVVYLPLEELLDKLEFSKNPYNYFRTENNKFEIFIYGGYTGDIYNMEIGKKQIVYTQSPVTYAPGTRETMEAPVLRNGLIYIPFEYVKYIFNSSGLYHIVFEGNTKQADIEKTKIPAENSYNGWIIGGVTVIVALAFITGYCIGRKKQ